MSGDDDDELSKFDKFWDDDDDTIKPIDLQGDPLRTPSLAPPPLRSNPEPSPAPNPAPDMPKDPALEATAENKDAEGEPPAGRAVPSNLDDLMGDKDKDAAATMDANKLAEARFLKDIDAEEEKNSKFLEIGERTLIKKGDYFDLLAHDPTLHDVYVGAGWDQRSFENAPVDVDLSLFLLNKDEKTREDGDFVFYNNQMACDGAVKLLEDSRTGAGDGDDERMFLDLRGVPFDVQKIRFVLSVYDEKLEGFSLESVRSVYFRLGNNADGLEIFCFEIADVDMAGAKAIEVGSLVREGPKWYFEAEAKPIAGGHIEVAKSYGMLITEDTG